MSDSPAIKLVAIDLDGTLLNDSKQVSDKTARALSCLPARGVPVVIASARPPRSVRHVYQALKLDTWQINYNGAMIWDEPRREVVFHRPMEGDRVRRIIDHARSLSADVLVSCEVQDRWYTDAFEQKYTTETGRLFRPDRIIPIAQMCAEPVTKLMLLGDPQAIDRMTPVLEEAHPDVSVIHSDPDLIQVMDRTASKAAALSRVAKHYRVQMDRVMAIGDAINDLPMLRAVGVAVAMDNAHPAVKQVADWVAPSNNDHGVYAALARFGLCE